MMKILWNIYSMPELAILGKKERHSIIHAAAVESNSRWRTWIGVIPFLITGTAMDLLHVFFQLPLALALIGALVGQLVFYLFVISAYAKTIRENLGLA